MFLLFILFWCEFGVFTWFYKVINSYTFSFNGKDTVLTYLLFVLLGPISLAVKL